MGAGAGAEIAVLHTSLLVMHTLSYIDFAIFISFVYSYSLLPEDLLISNVFIIKRIKLLFWIRVREREKEREREREQVVQNKKERQ